MKLSKKNKERIIHLVDFLTAFLVFSMVTVAFHEYGHATLTRALGGTAEVKYLFFSGYTVIDGLSGATLVAVAFIGGLGCFLLFLYFYLWWLDEAPDYYARLACLYWLGTQLAYGILEGIHFWVGGVDLGMASMAGSVFGMILVFLSTEKKSVAEKLKVER